MKLITFNLVCAAFQAFIALAAQASHRPLLAWWCIAWALYSVVWVILLMSREE